MTLSQDLNILVLGAQSSVGKAIISKFSDNHKIHATHRSDDSPSIKNIRLEWIQLDLACEKSIDLFLDKASYISTDVIIDLIGSFSSISCESSLQSISSYFQTYIANHSFLLERLFLMNSAKNFLFINLSSRSVFHGSHDVYYSGAKSALHGITKSLAKLHCNSRCVNLVPGLLKNSNMYLSMPQTIRDNHEKRAGGELMDINEFAEFTVGLISKLIDLDKDADREVDIYVGPQYE